MDTLAHILTSLRLQSSLYCRSELAAPWGLHFVQHEVAVFHVIDQGGCWLQLAGETHNYWLEAGDVFVLPHGSAHTIKDNPASEPYPPIHMDEDVYRECQIWRAQHSGPTVLLLCGTFQTEQGQRALWNVLPQVIHITRADVVREGLELTLKQMAAEAGSQRPGSEIVLRRLADVLLVQVIRLWLNTGVAETRSWLGAMRDPQISRALGLIHQTPQHPWTVAMLAREVAMSRSGFAARFTALVGEPPMQYLARWRMKLAAQMLNDGTSTDQIPERLGYTSAVAFAKAFKREHGSSPRRYRRQMNLPQSP